MDIAEDCSDIARAHGWRVLIKDSEIPQPPEIEPSQSGPRIGDD